YVDDVRMGQLRHRPRLFQKTRMRCTVVRPSPVRPQKLERDLPVELWIVRFKDDAHPTRTNRAGDDVASYGRPGRDQRRPRGDFISAEGVDQRLFEIGRLSSVRSSRPIKIEL